MPTNNFDILKLYDQVNDNDVLFTYKGEITSTLITNFLEVIEGKLDVENKKKIKRKVYYVSVECLQNLYHHIDKAPTIANLEDNFAIFVLSKKTNGYRIFTGNFVYSDKIQILKDRMDQINALSNVELKALYKLVLNNQEFSDKGGGGLGMIDIVKRTGNKLYYKFYHCDGEYYFFELNITVN